MGSYQGKFYHRGILPGAFLSWKIFTMGDFYHGGFLPGGGDFYQVGFYQGDLLYIKYLTTLSNIDRFEV